MSQTTEILDSVVATHIPADVMRMSHHNLGYSCCPATATDDCYLTTVVPFKLFFHFFNPSSDFIDAGLGDFELVFLKDLANLLLEALGLLVLDV